MSAHRRRDVRPRYGRIAAAALSTGVTALAVLGGVGALPVAADPSASVTSLAVAATAAQDTGAAQDSAGIEDSDRRTVPVSPDQQASEVAARTAALPARSGQGRRVVYSEQRQRVWLVAGDGDVRRTYLVSGSVYDNLDPGTYSVYSRSERAWGIDDSGTMQWFVRFTQGDRGAAIGFHDIPVDDGQRVQTVAELGTPTSHGCIRQRTADAKALWAFAPIGTTVVVTA